MNVISIAERNKRIQDDAARDLIKYHMLECLKHFQEALKVQVRYQLLDVPCVKIVQEAVSGIQRQNNGGRYER